MSDSSNYMIESPEDRRRLLRFARQVARSALSPALSAPVEKLQVPGQFGGVFVTFWNGQRLRGCMGTFTPTNDVAATIEEMTRASLQDPRFTGHPISAQEVDKLTIEISILSDPTPADDPLSLIPGTHGVLIRRGGRSGCFLPKVATEQGWSVEEFLSKCCTMKAGLSADAWKHPDTNVFLFFTDVFSQSPGAETNLEECG